MGTWLQLKQNKTKSCRVPIGRHIPNQGQLPENRLKFSAKPFRNSFRNALSDFSLNHATNSFILDSTEFEIAMALYKDYAF